MNLRVGLLDAQFECQWRRASGGFLVGERHVFNSQGTGHLARGVGTHAVRYYKQPAAAAILLRAPGWEHGLGVLIVRPPATDVGQVAVVEGGARSHASNPWKAGGWGKERKEPEV
jgi:hypothetical protein